MACPPEAAVGAINQFLISHGQPVWGHQPHKTSCWGTIAWWQEDRPAPPFVGEEQWQDQPCHHFLPMSPMGLSVLAHEGHVYGKKYKPFISIYISLCIFLFSICLVI